MLKQKLYQSLQNVDLLQACQCHFSSLGLSYKLSISNLLSAIVRTCKKQILTSFAVKPSSDLLLELQKSLLSASSAALTDLVEGRKQDGTVALQEAAEQLQEPVFEALKSLQPSIDGFGRQLPFIYPFRQQKKHAKAMTSTSAPAGSQTL